jgi:hypothetical protein
VPFHLAANFVAITDAVNMDVPALNDDVLLRQNSHHVPDRDVPLIASYAGAVTLLRTRYNSPKIRQVTPSYVSPVNTTLLPGTRPGVADFRARPFILRAQEEIVIESTDSAAGPNNHYVLSWYDFGRIEAPLGDVYGLRGTSTTAGVASTWTTADVTWENTLPAGRYAVIGGQLISATNVAWSLIFYDQMPRPGGLGQAAAGLYPWEPQLNGGLGVWGWFTTITLPRLRILDNATGNAHTIILQVIRVQ